MEEIRATQFRRGLMRSVGRPWIEILLIRDKTEAAMKIVVARAICEANVIKVTCKLKHSIRVEGIGVVDPIITIMSAILSTPRRTLWL